MDSKLVGLNAMCIDFGNSLISEADWIKCKESLPLLVLNHRFGGS